MAFSYTWLAFNAYGVKRVYIYKIDVYLHIIYQGV